MTVNPGGEEDSPDPDAEETDVFLVMGADRRARKTREEGQESPRTAEATDIPDASRAPEAPEAPEVPEVPAAPREHGSPPYRGAPLFAPESETTDPGGPEEETDASPKTSDPVRPDTDTVLVQAPPPAEAAERSGPVAGRESAPPGARDPEQGAPYPVYGDRPLASTGFPDIPAAPYAGVEQPEPDRGVPHAEGRLDIPTPDPSAPYAPTPDLPTPNPPNPWAPAQDPPARGIESWIDAAGDGRTPVQGGYEQRIAAVRSVPASSWRRAVFAVTGGRLNLG